MGISERKTHVRLKTGEKLSDLQVNFQRDQSVNRSCKKEAELAKHAGTVRLVELQLGDWGRLEYIDCTMRSGGQSIQMNNKTEYYHIIK